MAKSGLKRTQMKRKKKTNAKYNAFMKQFRGMPCFICGNRFALGHETAGHHILYRSTHPEYATEEMNVVPLCSNCHIPIAHEQAEKFIEFLEKKDPARYAWYVEHNHHKIKKRGT